MKEAIAYYRVSTQKQGKSGLGLEAQKSSVESFCSREGYTIAHSFTEIESGANVRNKMVHGGRVELSSAIALAKLYRVPIVAAKLDRIGRDTAFISGLMASGVQIIIAELGAEIPTFVLQMLSVIGELERKMISDRTKAALQEAKARGVKLGTANPRIAAKAIPAAHAATRAKGVATWNRLEWRITAAYNAGCSSNGDVADWFNLREIYTPRGNPWTKYSIAKYTKRWKAERDLDKQLLVELLQ